MRTYQALGFAPKGILAMGASFASPDFMKALGKNADYAFSHTKFDPSLIEKRRAAAAVNKLYEQRSWPVDLGRPGARVHRRRWSSPTRSTARSRSSPEDIIQALRETNIDGSDTIAPYKGIRFNEKGQNVLATGLITQIQDGKHYPVWPKDLATKPFIFPAPGWDKR